MPKITKKKKEKAADFSKAKLKLGKGKQVANNATDTSYKARCELKSLDLREGIGWVVRGEGGAVCGTLKRLQIRKQ